MKKKILWSGPDHTYMMTIFRNLILKTGIRESENLVFAGCEGPCFSMATFFSFGIRDLKLNLFSPRMRTWADRANWNIRGIWGWLHGNMKPL